MPIRVYKSQRCPRTMSPDAHHTMVANGFRLESFQWQGHDGGRYHYEREIDGVTICASFDPKQLSGRYAALFFSDGNGGRQVWHGYLDREQLPLDRVPAAVSAWRSIRRDPSRLGKVAAAHSLALRALMTNGIAA